MATSPLSGYESYESKTFIYKTVDSIELKLDVLYPTSRSQSSPLNVLIHIHGGFLVSYFPFHLFRHNGTDDAILQVVGDRYSFVPHWLISACVSRNWIFVTPGNHFLYSFQTVTANYVKTTACSRKPQPTAASTTVSPPTPGCLRLCPRNWTSRSGI